MTDDLDDIDGFPYFTTHPNDLGELVIFKSDVSGLKFKRGDAVIVLGRSVSAYNILLVVGPAGEVMGWFNSRMVKIEEWEKEAEKKT